VPAWRLLGGGNHLNSYSHSYTPTPTSTPTPHSPLQYCMTCLANAANSNNFPLTLTVGQSATVRTNVANSVYPNGWTAAAAMTVTVPSGSALVVTFSQFQFFLADGTKLNLTLAQPGFGTAHSLTCSQGQAPS
jgi:hypothetical protein